MSGYGGGLPTQTQLNAILSTGKIQSENQGGFEAFNGTVAVARRAVVIGSNIGGGIGGIGMGSGEEIRWTNVASGAGDGGNMGNADTGISRTAAKTLAIGTGAAGDMTGTLKVANIVAALPTSAGGLVAGQLWNNAGVVNVVP
jgi:hypothetical protein